MSYQEIICDKATKDASADDDVRMLVVKGAGRGFCAGICPSLRLRLLAELQRVWVLV